METEKMSTLSSHLTAAMHEGMSVDKATDHVIHVISVEELRVLVRPAVFHVAKQLYRRSVRRIERRVFDRVRPVTNMLPNSEEIRMLFGQSWRADGKDVFWESATAQQHRDRAAALRVFADKANQSADQHERAALAIEEAGVESIEGLLEKKAA